MDLSVEGLMAQYSPLIKWWSRKYYLPHYSVEDLEQEFNVVLVKCHEAFDPNRNVKFNTYLTTAVHRFVAKKLKKRRVEEFPADEDFGHTIEVVDRSFPECLTCGERIVADMLLMGYTSKEIVGFGVNSRYLLGLKRKFTTR